MEKIGIQQNSFSFQALMHKGFFVVVVALFYFILFLYLSQEKSHDLSPLFPLISSPFSTFSLKESSLLLSFLSQERRGEERKERKEKKRKNLRCF